MWVLIRLALENTNLCVRLNADGSRDWTFTNRISGSIHPEVNSIAPQPDGKILIGGRFSTVNGLVRNHIARLNPNGSLDLSFNPSNGPNNVVYKLLLLDDGRIIAVGDFTSYSAVPRSHVVRLNSNGSIDVTFDPGPGPDTGVWDAAPIVGGRLAIGGGFRSVSGFLRYGFAVLSENGQLVTHYNFERFAATSALQFGLRVEPEVPFELLSSSNLLTWQGIYSNLLHQSFTNLILPCAGQDKQFFRVRPVR